MKIYLKNRENTVFTAFRQAYSRRFWRSNTDEGRLFVRSQQPPGDSRPSYLIDKLHLTAPLCSWHL